MTRWEYDTMEALKEQQAKMQAAIDDSYHAGGYISEPTEEELQQKEFAVSVYRVVEDLARLLIDKNRKYGDSALNPARIFSNADATEQIKVRIDDKLNRIKNQQDDEDEDAVKDLTGYLILFMIARGY